MNKKSKIFIEENLQLQLYYSENAKKAIENGKINIAIKNLKSAVKYGEKGNGLIMLIHLLIENKKYDDAIKYCNYAIKKEPNNGKVFFYKGLALFKKGEKYRETINYFQEALKIGGYLTQEQILASNYYTGISYFNLRKYKLALTYFERITKIRNNFMDLKKWIEKTKKEMR